MITVQDQSVENGARKVVLTRALKGITSDHYSFDVDTRQISFINALGASEAFVYHNTAQSSNIILFDDSSTTCLCKTYGSPGTLDGVFFDYNCPYGGDLQIHNNPSCNITTYTGGILCCRHGNILYDTNQEASETEDTFQVKMRFYYEPYRKQHNAWAIQWSAAGDHVEHDIVQCPAGTKHEDCTMTVTGTLTLRDYVSVCSMEKDPRCIDQRQVIGDTVFLLQARPHCHGPGCTAMIMYILDDSGNRKPFCQSIPIIGEGEKDQFDEEGYMIAIPPCLWGWEDGLPDPIPLSLDTTFMFVEHEDATNKHLGNMHFWYFRGAKRGT